MATTNPLVPSRKQKTRKLRKTSSLVQRCVLRKKEVETGSDGTLYVPLMTPDPNRNARAWSLALDVDFERSRIACILPCGQGWIKEFGKTAVTAHG